MLLFKTGKWLFLHFQFACLHWGEAALDCNLGSNGRTEVPVGRDRKQSWLQKILGRPIECVDFYQELMQDDQFCVYEELLQIMKADIFLERLG